MPDVRAGVAELDAYRDTVDELERTRRRALDDAVAALTRFFQSGSAFGPTASEAPAALDVLFRDTGVVGASATAAAFRLSLIHISEPTRPPLLSRMPSSA